MNDADKKLIDAFRYDGYLKDLFAAVDRALADTPTLVASSLTYCKSHDQFTSNDSPSCDVGALYEDLPCDLRPLVYVEARP